MATRQVRAVFANYKRKVQSIDGKTVYGPTTANRGDTIDTDTLAPGELERLDRLGSLMAEGGEVPADRLEEALTRALSPLDVAREDFGAPMLVAAPGLGAMPVGDFTKGDTGVDPADQPPPLTSTVTLGQGTAEEQAALERLRAEPNSPRSDAPDVEDTGALAEFIKSEKLNGPDTVALAEDDPDRARYVLEAEKAASGQDPRANVEGPLQKIIKGGGE
jgi:hypothetical protein